MLAWSGTGGLDMVSGFPWVPPHVHFMVWLDGVPVDPYRAAGEEGRVCWRHGNDPETSDETPGDGRPLTLSDVAVDAAAIDHVLGACSDAAIRKEIENAPHAATRAAIVEDSLHHDRDAWPAGIFGTRLRPASNARVELTLPLPAAGYRGARACDGLFTKPR